MGFAGDRLTPVRYHLSKTSFRDDSNEPDFIQRKLALRALEYPVSVFIIPEFPGRTL
jgi:hypothetical protein